MAYEEDVVYTTPETVWEWQEVEIKNYASGDALTTVYFTGLSGNDVREYMLRFNAYLSFGSPSQQTFYTRVNNDQTVGNYYSDIHISGNNASTDVHTKAANLNLNNMPIASTVVGHSSSRMRGEIRYYPQLTDGYVSMSGHRRIKADTLVHYDKTKFFQQHAQGIYAGTDEVTELSVTVTNSQSMYGKFELLQLVRV